MFVHKFLDVVLNLKALGFNSTFSRHLSFVTVFSHQKFYLFLFLYYACQLVVF